MKINIEINNLSEEEIDSRLAKIAAALVIENETKETDYLGAEASIAFVGEREMIQVNKKYRGKDEATDVLSFAYGDNAAGFTVSGGIRMLGELVVCSKRVRKDAKDRGKSFEEEMIWAVIHGILHLLGYNHEKGGEESKTMRGKEKDYLDKLKIEKSK